MSRATKRTVRSEFDGKTVEDLRSEVDGLSPDSARGQWINEELARRASIATIDAARAANLGIWIAVIAIVVSSAVTIGTAVFTRSVEGHVSQEVENAMTQIRAKQDQPVDDRQEDAPGPGPIASPRNMMEGPAARPEHAEITREETKRSKD